MGHSLLSSALIWQDKDPLPLRLEAFLTPAMATSTYPLLTPTEGMLNIAGDVNLAGYQLKGVVVDAQFTTSLGLRSLDLLNVPFIGKCRINLKVRYQEKLVKVKELAEQFRPGRARWYKRFGWYAKRLKVYLPEVGEVDLVLVWKHQGYGYELFALVSTVKAGLQEVLGAWKRRWELEKSHRLYKQNFGLGDCQCRRYAAQLKHADLVHLLQDVQRSLNRLLSSHLEGQLPDAPAIGRAGDLERGDEHCSQDCRVGVPGCASRSGSCAAG